MTATSDTKQYSAEEIERIRGILIDDGEALAILSGMHTCFEADEDHGGIADEDITGGTIQRARDIELAMNWLKPGYIAPAFPEDWMLAEMTKLREENNTMRSALERLDGELDRQIYDDEHVRSMRNSGQDIAPDCEHHVVIRHELWSAISDALNPK